MRLTNANVIWFLAFPVLLLVLLATPAANAASPRPADARMTLAQVGAGPPSAWRGTPPPAPPVERVEPRRGFVWVDGNFEWRGDRYVWMGGHWEPERPGRRWHGGHWEWQGNRYVWTRGEWVDGPGYAGPQAVVAEPPPPPPPPPQTAPQSPPPRPGFVWIPGNNEWRDGRYVWIEGHWERERHGQRWQSGHWDRDGGRHAWHPGEWRREQEADRDRNRDRGYPTSISGRILDRNGAGVPGVTVVLAGTSEGRVLTDQYGNYTFAGLAPGSYAVRPAAGGCSFAPDVANLNNVAAGAVQDFNAACRRR